MPNDQLQNAGMTSTRLSDGKFVDVNADFLTMFAYQRDEVIGHTAADLNLYVEPAARAALLGLIRETGGARAYELLMRTKSGELRNILISTAGIMPGTNAPLLEILVDDTGRKQAEQTILRRNVELAALIRMGQSLSRLAEPAEVIELIYTLIGQILNNQNLYIALYDEPAQSISFPLYVIHGKRIAEPTRQLGPGLTEYVLRQRAPLFLPHDPGGAARALGLEPHGLPACCFLAVPMLARDKLVGVIGLQDYEHADIFELGHVEILKTIASQAAIALENARLFAATEQLAQTDDLTGIANRRQLFELGARELSRARRFGHPLSAMMVDIDDFKQVNDTYGHAVGDQVLQSIARWCLELVREGDVVARYGGEEFVILSHETDLTGAHISAERVRTHVAQKIVASDQGPLSVTISIGVAGALVDSDGFAALIERADSALYVAKQLGRNQVAAAQT